MPAEAALTGEPVVPVGLAAESSSPPEAPVPLTPPPEDGSAPVQLFHQRKPSLLTGGELRRLRQRHDGFANSLATRLSIHLRLEIRVQVQGLEACFYPQFLQRLRNPTQIALFQVESMEGVGLLEIPPKLGIAVVDRLLGGTGQAEALERDLTEIETALLDLAIELILKEWCQGVASLTDPKPSILGHETNPRFLPAVASDAPFLILTLEFHLNDYTEKVHLGLPHPMLQQLIRLLNPPLELKKQTSPPAPTPVRWNPQLGSVRIPLSVEWAGLEIEARKLAHLKVGDVLPLDPDRVNRTSVHLAGMPKFTGRLGKCGNFWAVELQQKV